MATRAAISERRWFWLAISALIGFILWLPPIVEQVTSADGNLSKILRFFLTPDPADPSAPFMQALRVWAAATLAPLAPDLHFAVGGLLAREASTPIVALALLVVVLLIAAGWRSLRRGAGRRGVGGAARALPSMRGSAASARWSRSRRSWR